MPNTSVPVCFSPYQKFPPGELCPRLDFPREKFCPRIIFPPAGQNSPTSIPVIRVFQATSSNKNLAAIMTNEHDETNVNECDETTIIFVVRNHNFFVQFQCIAKGLTVWQVRLEGQVRLVKIKLVAQVRMGGEPGGSGGQSPPVQATAYKGGPGTEPPVYKCTAYKGGPGACPQFGRLGQRVRLGQLRLN